jgi:signal transduction histidine kinase
MNRSAKKLSRMATAMFQLSIAPRFEIALNLKPGEIRDTVEHALDEIAFLAEEKRINIDVDLAPSPKPLLFELEKIEQVVVNLLFNACKFVPRTGSIQIKGYPYFWERRTSGLSGVFTVPDRRIRNERTPNAYRLDIEDSGPGVPPTHLAEIFEEYATYSGGTDRSGGGLGLAICRLIIHQHEGRIWAESGRQGAMFSFVLPFKRQDAASRQDSSASGAVSV